MLIRFVIGQLLHEVVVLQQVVASRRLLKADVHFPQQIEPIDGMIDRNVFVERFQNRQDFFFRGHMLPFASESSVRQQVGLTYPLLDFISCCGATL